MNEKKLTDKSNSDEDLTKRLREAEEIIDALRNHKVDAVVGTNEVAIIRLRQVENERDLMEAKLRKLNVTLEDRISERTKMSEARANKLREMALQMSQIEEKERQRLSRVLHDGLQQLLIGAKFNTRLIRNKMTGQDEILNEIDQLDQILDQSIETSRSLSYELSPPILHDHGLYTSLKWLAELRQKQGLNVEVHADDEIPRIPQNLKVLLYHAVGELLLNIIKHANVDHAKVIISSDEQNMIIKVIDRGKGYDVKAMWHKSTESLGLISIRKKLDLMNGSMIINSAPGQGCQVVLRVPVEDYEDPALKDTGLNTHGIPANDRMACITDSGTIGVLVVDDHQVMRKGLVRMLNEDPEITIVGEAGNGLEAIEFVHNCQPDVIIMDISMPEMDGIEATRIIHEKFPEIKIIGLSMHLESEYIRLITEAGAVNLLSKGCPAEDLFSAVRGNQ